MTGITNFPGRGETGFGLKLKDELCSFADGWQEVSERIGQSRPLEEQVDELAKLTQLDAEISAVLAEKAGQLDRMRSAAASRGQEIVVELSDEGVSGKIAPAKREGLAAAVYLLCDGQADVLVVAKLDRLTRTTRHLLEVLDMAERCKFGVVALDSDVDTTTAPGRLVATMMGGVAEWERRVIGERTKAALAVKKAQGARLGGPVTTPEPIRRRVAELHAAGVSLARIAAQINEDGHCTSVGTCWSKSGVQRLVDGLRLDAEAAAAAG